MTEADPDATLVGRCLHGDLEAFGVLMERYQRQVFSAVLHMVGNYEDASELSQQIFMKAFENLRTYDVNRKFFSWIYRVAMNESINHLKTRRQWEPIQDSLATPHAGPADHFESGERSLEIQRAVRALDPIHRAVIVSRHFLDLSYSEAAEVLGIPEKTFKSRLFEARQLLREALEARGYGR